MIGSRRIAIYRRLSVYFTHLLTTVGFLCVAWLFLGPLSLSLPPALHVFLFTLFVGSTPLLYWMVEGLSELVLLDILEATFVGTQVSADWHDGELQLKVSTRRTPIRLTSVTLELELERSRLVDDDLYPSSTGYRVNYQEIVATQSLLPAHESVLVSPDHPAEFQLSLPQPGTAHPVIGIYRLTIAAEGSLIPVRVERHAL